MGSIQENDIKQLPLSVWRNLVVIKILKLDPLTTYIPRNIQFVTTAILDKYLCTATERNIPLELSLDSILPTSIALVNIACKFHLGRAPKSVKLLQYFH